MFKINKLEAVFLPEEQTKEMEDWIADMESQGFVLWDRSAPICMHIRMVPKEMVDMYTEMQEINNQRRLYAVYES